MRVKKNIKKIKTTEDKLKNYRESKKLMEREFKKIQYILISYLVTMRKQPTCANFLSKRSWTFRLQFVYDFFIFSPNQVVAAPLIQSSHWH